MSNNLRNPSRLLLTSILIAPALAAMVMAAPASAAKLTAAPHPEAKLIAETPPPMDLITQEGEQNSGPNHFFINNNHDVELIRFKAARDLEMCAGRGQDSAFGRVPGYAIQVTYDTGSATIMPGSCETFQATSVKVRAGSPLPEDTVLEGEYKILK